MPNESDIPTCRISLSNQFKKKIIMKKNPRDYNVNGKQYAYILDCICPENADLDPNAMNDRDRIKFVLDTFDKENNYVNNKLRNPSLTSKFEDWIRGLPSVFCVTFDNYSIAQIGKEWGYCETDKKTSDFVNNWWSSIADKFFQLARILDVDYTKYM